MSLHQEIPKDPVILLSYLNTQLRDYFPSLEELCKSRNLNRAEVEQKMQSLDYYYDSEKNKFV